MCFYAFLQLCHSQRCASECRDFRLVFIQLGVKKKCCWLFLTGMKAVSFMFAQFCYKLNFFGETLNKRLVYTCYQLARCFSQSQWSHLRTVVWLFHFLGDRKDSCHLVVLEAQNHLCETAERNGLQ